MYFEEYMGGEKLTTCVSSDNLSMFSSQCRRVRFEYIKANV